MNSISLNDFLETYGVGGGNAAAVTALPSGVEVVEAMRRREIGFRRLLPPQLVRRLDRGFARSNTVHPDTGQALYAICRASGARVVFETGTYWGYSTTYLAAALQDAGAKQGRVHTFDIYLHAGKHIPKSLRPRIEMHRGKPSTELMPPVLAQVTPDLFFQDSRHDYEGVAGELNVVVPHLKAGAVVLFHDFVMPDVRRAAQDVLLPDFDLYLLETQDPQQVGVAVKIGLSR